jgi:hypothetical protein
VPTTEKEVTAMTGFQDVGSHWPVGQQQAPLAEREADEIAVEGFLYGYPLVLMDLTRRAAAFPVNQFSHARAFPDARWNDVVRPNADTLYSQLWFDVSNEPLVIHIPSSAGRYYLLPLLDMWTDVFDSPGTRTTGGGEQAFAIVASNWQGHVPDDVAVIRSPTTTGWVIGRTQTNGEADYHRVHSFQDALTATPLSAWGHYYEPPTRAVTGERDFSPLDQLVEMDGVTFFERLAQLLPTMASHANDYPVLHRLARIGLIAGRAFDVAGDPEVRAAVEDAPDVAQARIRDCTRRGAALVNGWSLFMNPIGTYGTDYLRRAMIAVMGLGANVVEDAIYPTAFGDIDGRPLGSGERYVIHFEPRQLPPVRAFWSLSLYNDRQLFADNVIDRYAIGDRDHLTFNRDGSLDILVQRPSPGDQWLSNWLPAPASGGFSLTLRLYWPKPDALDRRWAPPPIKRVG